jgi:hypothetical protein
MLKIIIIIIKGKKGKKEREEIDEKAINYNGREKHQSTIKKIKRTSERSEKRKIDNIE